MPPPVMWSSLASIQLLHFLSSALRSNGLMQQCVLDWAVILELFHLAALSALNLNFPTVDCQQGEAELP
jgi:hypothetical protein